MALKYRKFSPKYSQRFEEMKEKILELSLGHLEIEHIGSTAVEGLGGKGIIDVLIGIRKWDEAKEVLAILKKLGFKHFHAMENHGLFVSTQKDCGENDFHVHIARIGTKRYARDLAFRDCLRKKTEMMRRYKKMKQEAFRESGGKRRVYRELKNQWFLDLGNCS